MVPLQHLQTIMSLGVTAPSDTWVNPFYMGKSRLPDTWVSLLLFLLTPYLDTWVSPFFISSLRYSDTALDLGRRRLVWQRELIPTRGTKYLCALGLLELLAYTAYLFLVLEGKHIETIL